MRRLVFLLVAHVVAFVLHAQPTLVKNINSTNQGGGIQNLTSTSFGMFFSADNGISGAEVWTSDGTPSGTTIVKDVRSGELGSWPLGFYKVNNHVYFSAVPLNSRLLWRTDGTSPGTQQFATQNPVSNMMTQGQNKMYYWVSSGSSYDLYEISGSPAMNTKLKSFKSGSFNMTEMNDILYFTPDDNTYGSELWRTDGTVAGTTMVKDIHPSGHSNIRYLTHINGTLYFIVTAGPQPGLWKSDGTEAGTVFITNSFGFANLNLVSNLTNVNGTLFFSTHDPGISEWKLWKSDGTSGGTVVVKTGEITQKSPANFINLNGMLLFTAEDTNGVELWSSDGTEGGTTMVKDIYSGAGSANPTSLTIYGNDIFFQAQDGDYNIELWKSNGTATGTQLVKEINSSAGSNPEQFVIYNDILYFVADNGTDGPELWKSEGDESSTQLVKNINLQDGDTEIISFVPGNTHFYFMASHPLTGQELWRSNGTDAGTVLVKNIAPGPENSYPSLGAIVDNSFFFSADDKVHGRELWKTDGTENGTELIKDISSGFYHGIGDIFRNLSLNNKYFFLANANDGNSTQLWVTDGTEGNTYAPKISTSATGSVVNELTIVDDVMYYKTATNHATMALWKSDGTTPGTQLVKNLGRGWYNSQPAAFNGLLIFPNRVGAVDAVGIELWKSDGTEQGTVLLKDINPNGSSNPNYFYAVDDFVYFQADDGVHGVELWRTDGTPEGTMLLKDIKAGTGASNPYLFIKAQGNQVYFIADNGIHGTELWTSDGTATGTVMVKDIYPGSNSSDPGSLTFYNSAVYFSANDGTRGLELWTSSGTEESTVIVADLKTGSNSATPYVSGVFNNALYFSAHTAEYGRELWKYTSNCSNPTITKVSADATTLTLGEQSDLTVAGNLNDAIKWVWYKGSCGGTLVGEGTTISLVPDQTTTYYVRGEGGCVSNMICFPVTITVTTCELPEITSTTSSESSVVAGESVDLTVEGNLRGAMKWVWYVDECDGVAIGEGETISVSPDETTTYYVRGEGGCITDAVCNSLIVTVAPCELPIISSATSNVSSIVAGESANLTVTGNLQSAIKWVWYKDVCGGTSVVGEGGTISVSPDQTTTYYVSGVGGCIADAVCSDLTVTVTPCELPIINSTTSNVSSIIAGENVDLIITGNLHSATKWAWYKDACGSIPVGEGGVITVTPDQTTTYYVRGEGGCIIDPVCNSITVTVTPCVLPVITSVTSGLLSNATVDLTVTGNLNGAGKWVWYKNSCGSELLDEGATITVAADQTTTYFVRGEGGCIDISGLCESTTVLITGSEAGEREALNIHPNPLNAIVNIHLAPQKAAQAMLRITDRTGREMLNLKFTQAVIDGSLDLSNLEPGVYILKIKTANDGHWTEKIIKQ